MPDSQTDAELIQLLAQDNERAFRVLYDRYWYKMYLIAYRKLHRKEVAEELAQELFVMLWQKRKTIQAINLKAFLGVSLRNLLIDYIRLHIQEEQYLEHLRYFFPTESLATQDCIQQAELNELVEQTLTQLPEKTRQVFMMSRYEQLSIREIANRLNLSEKAIEYHITRSLLVLRENLRDFVMLLVIVSLW
ncbi:MAG: RNA polymerase sigma-70 factor [Siphonobacter sp.]